MHHRINIATIFSLALLLGIGCTIKQTTMSQQPTFPSFDTEGHRGARGLMPENTISAMIHAIDLGVTTIEMDSHISKDHQVIIAHDDYINPLFAYAPDGSEIPKQDAKKYVLFGMAYKELQQFDVGSKFYENFPHQQKQVAHIPLLADLIDSVQGYLKETKKPQVFYNIETKSSAKGDGVLNPEPEVFVKLLMEVIESKGITPWVFIQSFDVRTLQVLHKKYPKVKTSLLVSKGTLEDNLETLGFVPDIYSPAYKLVDAALIKACHDKHMKILPWTVNTKDEITQLKALGVDGIISDYPNLFNELKTN